MPYIIPFLLIFLGLVRPKDKWLTILFLLYYWALVGLNTYTPDYESYETKYDAFLLYTNYEIGFQSLNYLCYYLGLSYQEFRMVVAFLISCFTYIAVKRLSNYPNYLLALFLLWPFVGNVSGLRQGLANIIVCCGVPCLFKEGKSQIIKYLLWIALAWSIHQSSLFFLILLFARNEYRMKEKRMIIIMVVVGVFVIASTQILDGIPFIADNHKLNKWLNIAAEDGADHQNLAGFFIRTFLVCCYALLVPKLTAIIKKHSFLDELETKRLTVCSNASLLLLLSVPGYVVTGEYQRLLYALLLIFYAVFAEFQFKQFNKLYPKRFQLILVSFGMILLTAWYYTFSMSSHDILATFKDNLLFK